MRRILSVGTRTHLSPLCHFYYGRPRQFGPNLWITIESEVRQSKGRGQKESVIEERRNKRERHRGREINMAADESMQSPAGKPFRSSVRTCQVPASRSKPAQSGTSNVKRPCWNCGLLTSLADPAAEVLEGGLGSVGDGIVTLRARHRVQHCKPSDHHALAAATCAIAATTSSAFDLNKPVHLEWEI